MMDVKLRLPKDKSWSSSDSPVAVQKHARFSILSSLTSAPVAQDRLTYWRSVGAQASPTVERLISQAAKKAA
jgi:hypothetical protein